MDIILRRILDLKAQKGITNKQFQNDLGLYGSAVSEWKNGHSQSYLKRLPDIAKYLKVPVDVLLGNMSQFPQNEYTSNRIFFDERGNPVASQDDIYILENHEGICSTNCETTFDNEEINLLHFFRKFNKAGKKKIMAYMNDICHNEQYMEDEN